MNSRPDPDATVDHRAAQNSSVARLLPTDPPSARSARYQLAEVIGSGGMGVVFRGYDAELDRELAVKVLLDRHQDRPDLVRRFLEEAKVTGRLQHPGVAPIHEVGRLPDGRPFFAMKLVGGRTLAALLQDRPDLAYELPRLLKVFEQVCQTLAYVHSRGVIHRDLKPANIMVGTFGEVQVMDWGLARTLRPCPAGLAMGTPAADRRESTTEDFPPGQTTDFVDPGTDPEQLTQAGTAVGTPAYMAPEQARGEQEKVDERCDVFGLGAILCEVLTGQPPFKGKDGREALRLAQQGDLTDALARLDRCAVDAELVRLAKACLAAEPANRPRDAQAVAEAMAAYLAAAQDRLKGAEIERAAALARAGEERKRRRVTVALAAAVVALVLLGSGVWLWVQRQEAERQAEAIRRQTVQEQTVQAVLDKTVDLIRQSRWQEAEFLLDQATKELTGPGSEVLCNRLTQARQEARFHADVDGARLQRARLTARNRLDYSASPKAYNRAFSRFGFPVLQCSPEEVADRLNQLRPETRTAVLLALYEWAFFLPDRREKEHLWKIVLGADDDPWRQRLRTAWKEPKAKLALASQALTLELPAAYLELLYYQLMASGDFETAHRILQRAVDLHPSDFWAHYNRSSFNDLLLNQLANLGNERTRSSIVREKIGHLRAALAIRPTAGFVHNDLGAALATQGNLQGALVAFRKATVLEPNDFFAFLNLSRALLELGDPAEAITASRRAIALDPTSAHAQSYLGFALRQQSQFADARDAFRQAAALTSPTNPRLAQEYDQGAKDCDRLLEMDKRLPQVLAGRERPKDNADRLALAEFCYKYKKSYGKAAHLCADAFASNPKLAEDLESSHRYNAACYAALAAAGRGTDAAKIDSQERAGLRKQALSWLRADLALWTKRLESAKPAVRKGIRDKLEHWRKDKDLASLRDQQEQAKLSAEEQEACRKLWAEVSERLSKLERPK
jgi:serine/threonine-protein kinase